MRESSLEGPATPPRRRTLFNAPWRKPPRPQRRRAPKPAASPRCFDSVSVCFSKGLGAPIGSALCGTREFISRAHRIRKMAGGGMRQSGLLAAAAAMRLDHHIDRWPTTIHSRNASRTACRGIEGFIVEKPQTNIVFVDLEGPAKAKSAGLMAHLDRAWRAGHRPLQAALRHAPGRRRAGVDRAIETVRAYFKN
jgi:threonine aldolase